MLVKGLSVRCSKMQANRSNRTSIGDITMPANARACMMSNGSQVRRLLRIQNTVFLENALSLDCLDLM